MAQSNLGNIKNKPVAAFGVKVVPQAANTSLTKGQLVYQDGALGLKVVPISSQPAASRIGMIENDSNNNPGSLGNKAPEVYKHHTIAVVKLQGTMSIGGKFRASTTTAGMVSEIADPTDLATTTAFVIAYLGDYLGHVDEYLDVNKQITAGADGDEIVVAFR